MEPPQSIVSHPVHLKESWATLQHLTLRMAELHDLQRIRQQFWTRQLQVQWHQQLSSWQRASTAGHWQWLRRQGSCREAVTWRQSSRLCALFADYTLLAAGLPVGRCWGCRRVLLRRTCGGPSDVARRGCIQTSVPFQARRRLLNCWLPPRIVPSLALLTLNRPALVGAAADRRRATAAAAGCGGTSGTPQKRRNARRTAGASAAAHLTPIRSPIRSGLVG
mmetsp:Transcript_885/g.2717  ORF Transcript_885/g.2717 Transcript_885/m.2717 type:complete len:221 (+) Transcript_885:283-945(+)